MSEQSVTTPPAGLDRARVAEGLGELKDGPHYGRVLIADKTVAYIKVGRIAAKVEHLKGLPAKLGKAKPEKSGPWANVAVESDEAARAVLEHVVARAGEAEGRS